MFGKPTPQGGANQGLTPAMRIYFGCLCNGCIVTPDTLEWMDPFRDDPDRKNLPPRAKCPECDAHPRTFILTDPPTTNETHVDTVDDLIVDIQGKEEEDRLSHYSWEQRRAQYEVCQRCENNPENYPPADDGSAS